MIWKRGKDTAVVGDVDEPEPDELEPVFEPYIEGEYFVIQAADDHAQSIAAKHPVEIEE